MARADPRGALSVYGASKVAGEVAIREALGPHLIVRTSWVYAAQGTNFLKTIVRLSRERSELRIVADQIGAPTPARLIAQIVTTIIESADRTCERNSQMPEASSMSRHLVKRVGTASPAQSSID